MRALLLTVCVAACGSPDGTYLVFHSDGDRIEFDRIQVVFGKDIGTVVSTPEHPAGSTESQLVIVPTLLDQAIQLSSATTRLDYLLPEGEETRKLGRYALAVAFRGDAAVGIGDVFDFKVQTDGVYLYEVTLVPYASEDVEIYGRPTQNCLRWSRSVPDSRSPETIAVVRESDPDCDDFVGTADCDEGLYCDPSEGSAGCVTKNACITDTPFCQYGNCVNAGTGRQCEPTTCMLGYACGECDETQPTESFFRCGLSVPNDHPEVFIPTRGDGTMCNQAEYTFSVVLPDGLVCVNPKLESSTSEDGYHFAISPAPAPGTGSCFIIAKPPTPTTPLTTNNNHLLISIDAPNRPLPRTTLILGLNPASSNYPDTTCDLPTPIVEWESSYGPPASACTPQL